MKQDARYIRWLIDIRNEDVGLVGGKNASLGEMYSELTQKGVKIPDGFAVTAEGTGTPSTRGDPQRSQRDPCGAR